MTAHHAQAVTDVSETRICLGKPSEWHRLPPVVDHETGEIRERPFVRTSDRRTLVLVDEERILGALPDPCPHERCSLAAHGRCGPRPGTYVCKHLGYVWDEEGHNIETGARGSAGDIELRPVDVDADGRVWTTPPSGSAD